MRARIWGCRGSLATPGQGTLHTGGNTSCVEVRTETGAVVVLDAGTGIRPLGGTLAGVRELDLLLTHLHLDHIEGLAFFAPLHDTQATVRIWGPAQEDGTLAERVATWLSPPFFPLPFQQFEARIEIHEAPAAEWQIGGARVRCARTRHPGPTLAYRLDDGGRSSRASTEPRRSRLRPARTPCCTMRSTRATSTPRASAGATRASTNSHASSARPPHGAR